jgi:hypothetical protein
MEVRTMGRTLIDGWLRLARWPMDRVTKVLPGPNRGPQRFVSVAVDRTDAAVREAIGGVLRDDELQADGRRRRIAADERAQAAQLRLAADAKREDAEARAEAKRSSAKEQRERAKEEARAESAAVQRRRTQRKATVAKEAQAQEQAVDRATKHTKETLEKQAKRQRLEVLEDRSEALDVEADALTAADEAERLREAAAEAKAERKRATG